MFFAEILPGCPVRECPQHICFIAVLINLTQSYSVLPFVVKPSRRRNFLFLFFSFQTTLTLPGLVTKCCVQFSAPNGLNYWGAGPHYCWKRPLAGPARIDLWMVLHIANPPLGWPACNLWIAAKRTKKGWKNNRPPHSRLWPLSSIHSASDVSSASDVCFESAPFSVRSAAFSTGLISCIGINSKTRIALFLGLWVSHMLFGNIAVCEKCQVHEIFTPTKLKLTKNSETLVHYYIFFSNMTSVF